MLTIAIIVAVAWVIAVFMAALAYGGPKVFWYWSQSRLLGLQAEDQRMLMNLHVEEHQAELGDTTNSGAKITDIKLSSKPDNAGLYL